MLLAPPARFPKCKLTRSYLLFHSRLVRKAIARVLTVLSQTQRDSLKASLKGKKYLPTDLREKKTRAIRRRMTKFELSRETVRQHKRTVQKKNVRYAIKA